MHVVDVAVNFVDVRSKSNVLNDGLLEFTFDSFNVCFRQDLRFLYEFIVKIINILGYKAHVG